MSGHAQTVSCILGCGSSWDSSTIHDPTTFAEWHCTLQHVDLKFSPFAVEVLACWLAASLGAPFPESSKRSQKGFVCSFTDCGHTCSTAATFVVHMVVAHEVDVHHVLRVPKLSIPASCQSLSSWNLDTITDATTGQHVTLQLCSKPETSLSAVFSLRAPVKKCRASVACALRVVAKHLNMSFAVSDGPLSSFLTDPGTCSVIGLVKTSFGCRHAKQQCPALRQVAFVARCTQSTSAGVDHTCFSDSTAIAVLAAQAVICRAHSRTSDHHPVCEREWLNIAARVAQPYLCYLAPGDRRDDIALTVLGHMSTRAVAACAHFVACGHPPHSGHIRSTAPADAAMAAIHRHWRARSALTAQAQPGMQNLVGALRSGLLSDRAYVRFAGTLLKSISPAWLIPSDRLDCDVCIMMSPVALDIVSNSDDPVKAMWLHCTSVDVAAVVTTERYSVLTVRAAAPHGLDMFGAGEFEEGSGWDLPCATSTTNCRKYLTLLHCFIPGESEQYCLVLLRLVSLICGYAPVGPLHAAHSSWHADVVGKLAPHTYFAAQPTGSASSYRYVPFLRHMRFVASDGQPSFRNAVALLLEEFSSSVVPYALLDPPHLSTNLKRAMFSNLLPASRDSIESNRKFFKELDWMQLCNPIFIALTICDTQTAIRRLAHVLVDGTSGLSLLSVLEAIYTWLCRRLGALGSQQALLKLVVLSVTPDAQRLAQSIDTACTLRQFSEARQLAGIPPGERVHPRLTEIFVSLRYLDLGETEGGNPFMVGNTRSNEGVNRSLRTASFGQTVRSLVDQVRHDSNSICLHEMQGTVPELYRRWSLLSSVPSGTALVELVTADTFDAAGVLKLVTCWHLYLYSGTVRHLYDNRKYLSDEVKQLRTTSDGPLSRHAVLGLLKRVLHNKLLLSSMYDVEALGASVLSLASRSLASCRTWLSIVKVGDTTIEFVRSAHRDCPLAAWYRRSHWDFNSMSAAQIARHNAQCMCPTCRHFNEMVSTLAPLFAGTRAATTTDTQADTQGGQLPAGISMRPAKRRRKKTQHAKTYKQHGT